HANEEPARSVAKFSQIRRIFEKNCMLIRSVFLITSMCVVSSAADVTFYRDVLPVLQDHCQECHRPGEIGPMPLLTYQQARPWAKAIKTAVLTGKMPPWPADPHFGKFSNDRSLSKAQIETLAAWA